MITVLPLFFHAEGEDSAFLAADNTPGSSVSRLLRLCSMEGVTAYVVTDSARCAGFLANRGVRVLLARDADGARDHGMAPGSHAALSALTAQGLLRDDDVAVVADWLGHRTSPESLLAAYRRSTSEDGLFLATLRDVRDHPVQCQVPFRMICMDMLVFLDQAPRAIGLLDSTCLRGIKAALSRPFFLDWRELDVWEADGAVFAIAPETHSARPRAWRLSSASYPEEWQARLYLKAGPLTARRIIPSPWKTPAASQLVPAYARQSGIALRLERSSRRSRCHIDTSGLPEHAILRLWEFNALTLGEHHRTPLSGPESHRRDMPIAQASWPPGETPDGLIACLVTPSFGNDYDFTEHLTGEEDLWSVDPKSKLRVSPKTGKPFANRQEFPPLVEMTGAITAGKIRHLLNIQEAPAPLALAPLNDVEGSPRVPAPVGHQTCGGPESVHAKQAAPPVAGELTTLFEAIRDLTSIRKQTGWPRTGPDVRSDRSARSAFEAEALAVDLVLQECRWKYRQLDYLVSKYAGEAALASNLDSLTIKTFFKTEGLNAFYRESIQEINEAPLRQNPVGNTPESGPGRLARLASVALPGGQPPINPCHLASDGKDSLFINCVDFDWNTGLYLKNVRTGKLKTLRGPERKYNGICADLERKVLYAALRFENTTQTCSIDVLDFDGTTLSNHAMLTPVGLPRFTPTLLSGDNDFLYFVDAYCKIIVVIDKKTMQVSDILFPPDAESNWDVCPGNGDLYTASLFEHSIQRMDRSGNILVRNSDTHVIFPRVLDIHPITGELYCLGIDHKPHGLEDLRQTICLYSPSLEFRTSARLDDGVVMDMHILHCHGLLAVTDFKYGVKLYDISEFK